MQLFGKKDKTEDKNEATAADTGAKKEVAQTSSVQAPRASVLIRPHITEKAAIATDDNVYTFVVAEGASKYDVRDAIKATYNKTPRKVAIVKKPGKRVLRRGGMGTKKGLKKAYVYMKEGDTIDVL